MNNPSSHILLSELQAHIKTCLQQEFAGGYWITAEVSEAKENASGHFYMTLIEKNEKSQMPKARASAVIWSSRYAMIGSYFRSATGRSIEPGMKLLLKVEVSYHELYSLSLVVTDIDPTYTLGDLERQRQLIIARLKEEGYWELNRQIELPYVMQRIAVVSSATAAGYRDFMTELGQNEYGYRYTATLFEALMQGESAEASIVSALRRIEAHHEAFDAVAIIRGGGAQSDLACFDAFELACTVATMPIVVVTGIGHDKDTSIVDRVAGVSLKTPTAVARFFIDYSLEFDSRLNATMEYLKEVSSDALDAAKEECNETAARLRAIATSASSETMLLLKEKEERIRATAERYIDHAQRNIDRKTEALRTEVAGVFGERLRETAIKQERLNRGATTLVETEKHRLATATAIVEGFDPGRILANGYAIARLRGKTIKSKRELRIGDQITVRLSDGTIQSEVTDII